MPKTNSEYWSQKISANKQRDSRTIRSLAREDWKTLILWECELSDEARLERKLRKYLESH